MKKNRIIFFWPFYALLIPFWPKKWLLVVGLPIEQTDCPFLA